MRTRVGYSGGTTANPTYLDIGDHAETIQLDFDPQRISYADLLEVYWAAHDPTVKSFSTQYMAAIYYHDQAQRALAEQTKAAEAQKRGQQIHSEIRPASTFYLAEDYHQKYHLRSRSSLFKEMAHHYPQVADLIRSTAVARLNGYIGGYGSLAALEQEIDSLGLSPAGRAELLSIVKG